MSNVVRRRKWLGCVCFAFGLAFICNSFKNVQADGLVRDGVGAISTGRGGTNIAFSDNGAVMLDNPAGLANFEGGHFAELGIDTIITDYKLLTEFFCGIFYFIQKWMPHRASRWIRRVSKKWQRNSELIERRAREHAKGRGYRAVTCGHTHLPMLTESDGVTYVNSGTWTEAPPCPFVSVRGGEIRLETWPLAVRETDAPPARVEAAP
jgi:hypothetical protein